MKRYMRLGFGLLVILAVLSACGTQQEQPAEEGISTRLQVKSSAFEDGATMPLRYTCDGEDISPPLSWSEPPAGTQSLVLIGDDPDAPAGTWVHWVLFNVPATARSLPEGIPANEVIENGGVQGSNSWKRLGYGGPCPPKGSSHLYPFKLHALDTTLELDAGASKKDVEKAMEGHILAQGQVTARYER